MKIRCSEKVTLVIYIRSKKSDLVEVVILGLNQLLILKVKWRYSDLVKVVLGLHTNSEIVLPQSRDMQ